MTTTTLPHYRRRGHWKLVSWELPCKQRDAMELFSAIVACYCWQLFQLMFYGRPMKEWLSLVLQHHQVQISLQLLDLATQPQLDATLHGQQSQSRKIASYNVRHHDRSQIKL